MLIVKNVKKNYKDFTALEQIQLEMDKGIYGLLAPNGAGKTTLIKMLVTLIQPTEGEILYDGRDIYALDEEYRDILGYLPQQFGYYPNYTPKQYLLYLAALKGIPKKEALLRIEDLLEKVRLIDVINKKMKKFSGGMIQRVGIAQALLNDPKVLILDEPTAGLDPKERARFRHLLSELAKDRLIIISTHIVSDIESIANEIIMIKNKKVIYKDSSETICDMIAGIVYEATIANEDLDDYRNETVILSEKQERGQMMIRFLYEGERETGWTVVQPTLEDVFLYEYRDEG